jgi:enamine deaminase RidA (YjgF/YER057c/UK114 family)
LRQASETVVLKESCHEQRVFQSGDIAAAGRLFAHRQGDQGTLIYISGQVPCDSSGNLVGEGNFEAQAEQVFKNLTLALGAAGATMAGIVKMNFYLVAEVGQQDVPKLRAIRERYLGNADLPGRHARVCEPSGAARLASRDRGSRGDRRLKAKPVPEAATFHWFDQIRPRWRVQPSQTPFTLECSLDRMAGHSLVQTWPCSGPQALRINPRSASS